MSEQDFHKRPTHQGIYPESNTGDSASLPDKIGPYKVESLLEKGGMSILYLGTHPETKEPTTIKVLSPRYVTNPEITKRFLDEAEIIAMADHPNIVKLYGYGRWEGGLYIAMEFIEGISLRQYLLRTPLPLKRALEVTVDIAYALCHLHTHGVIHRDLKPENILVTESGSIKVIDFGIAQLLTDKNEHEAASRQRLMGTPIYMSPEQRNTPDEVSYPSDIYSLGIITYELILGKLCHGRIHISLMPKGVQKILSKMLQPIPDDRYQDIVDFIGDIAQYMHSESFKKEYQPLDQLSEMTLNMRLAGQLLLPSNTPDWKNLSISIAQHKGIVISGIYYDFLQHKNDTYSLICLEAVEKGVEGMVCAAIARGMIKSLQADDCPPEKLIPTLNNLLAKDNIQNHLLFTHLIYKEGEEQIHYFTTENTPLWHVEKQREMLIKLKGANPLLGISSESQFEIQTHSWASGDSLIIGSYSIQSNEPENERKHLEDSLSRILNKSLSQPPQEQVNGVLRRLRTTKDPIIDQNTITLLALTKT